MILIQLDQKKADQAFSYMMKKISYILNRENHVSYEEDEICIILNDLCQNQLNISLRFMVNHGIVIKTDNPCLEASAVPYLLGLFKENYPKSLEWVRVRNECEII